MNNCDYCLDEMPLLKPHLRSDGMGDAPFCPECRAGRAALRKTLRQVLRNHAFFMPLEPPEQDRINWWFQPHKVGQGKETAYQAVHDFAVAGGGPLLPSLAHQNSLYIYGVMGTGKTEALLSCAAQLIAFGHGYNMIVTSEKNLLHVLRSADQFDGTYHKLMRKFADTYYLLIDDVSFTERRDDERIWTDLFVERYKNRMPTLITAMHAIEMMPNITDIIKSRLLDQFVTVEMRGAVYRTTEEVRYE